MSGAKLAAAGVVTLAGVVLLTGLGLWQLRRLAWKEELIAAAESRAHAAPAPAPPASEWLGLRGADYEYRRVETQGIYDYSHQELVFRSLEAAKGRYAGVGYLVMTPMLLPGGESIIVNRGFVPEAMKSAAENGPRGATKVVGLMRASESRNLFTPADEPARGVFYTGDVEAMAMAMRLGAHAPFLIDAEAGPDPLPEGGETRLHFPNNHLSYALTWFGMAAALAGVFAAFALGQFQGRAARG